MSRRHHRRRTTKTFNITSAAAALGTVGVLAESAGTEVVYAAQNLLAGNIAGTGTHLRQAASSTFDPTTIKRVAAIGATYVGVKALKSLFGIRAPSLRLGRRTITAF